jgi:hypothetical protein
MSLVIMVIMMIFFFHYDFYLYASYLLGSLQQILRCLLAIFKLIPYVLSVKCPEMILCKIKVIL